MNVNDINKEQEKAGDSATAKEVQTETIRKITDKVLSKLRKIDLSRIDVGTFFTGVENMVKEARRLDLQVTKYASDLLTKITTYFSNFIEAHKKKK